MDGIVGVLFGCLEEGTLIVGVPRLSGFRFVPTLIAPKSSKCLVSFFSSFRLPKIMFKSAHCQKSATKYIYMYVLYMYVNDKLQKILIDPHLFRL